MAVWPTRILELVLRTLSRPLRSKSRSRSLPALPGPSPVGPDRTAFGAISHVWIPEGILLRHIPRKNAGVTLCHQSPVSWKGLPAVRPLVQCWGRNRGHSRDPGVVVILGEVCAAPGRGREMIVSSPPAAPRRCPVIDSSS